MSKIKKVDEVFEFSTYTKFTKDEGMFQIEASVYSMVSELPGSTNKYGHDISEIELRFLINNQHVQYKGFKELYEQLYGKDTFGDFYYKKSQEFEVAYLKTTPYKTK